MIIQTKSHSLVLLIKMQIPKPYPFKSPWENFSLKRESGHVLGAEFFL